MDGPHHIGRVKIMKLGHDHFNLPPCNSPSPPALTVAAPVAAAAAESSGADLAAAAGTVEPGGLGPRTGAGLRRCRVGGVFFATAAADFSPATDCAAAAAAAARPRQPGPGQPGSARLPPQLVVVRSTVANSMGRLVLRAAQHCHRNPCDQTLHIFIKWAFF